MQTILLQASKLLRKIIKLKYYFLTTYSDLPLKVIFIYKKLEMLKPINIQLKFIKVDKKTFCHFKPP